jgi:hypothetical protein
LATTVTNQNLIQVEFRRRLNSGKACYHSVQNLLFSCLISENLKIKIYKIIILTVVLYGCETSLTLREDHRLRLFEKRVQMKIFGPKRPEVTVGEGNCIMRSCVICTPHEVEIALSEHGG